MYHTGRYVQVNDRNLTENKDKHSVASRPKRELRQKVTTLTGWQIPTLQD